MNLEKIKKHFITLKSLVEYHNLETVYTHNKMEAKEWEISNGSNWYLMSCAVSRSLITKVPTHHMKSESDLQQVNGPNYTHLLLLFNLCSIQKLNNENISKSTALQGELDWTLCWLATEGSA